MGFNPRVLREIIEELIVFWFVTLFISLPMFILQASLNVTVFVMCLVRDFGIWAFYHTSSTHKILQTFEGKSFLE